ncbi:hypothetical protein R1flu_018420 [Riccia fluitans]|uniref:Uncharacterized protein n=1 Tax=Riccia fluitans TaxID=41844 RepID=A0ABD1ZFZ6_9MARC
MEFIYRDLTSIDSVDPKSRVCMHGTQDRDPKPDLQIGLWYLKGWTNSGLRGRGIPLISRISFRSPSLPSHLVESGSDPDLSIGPPINVLKIQQHDKVSDTNGTCYAYLASN